MQTQQNAVAACLVALAFMAPFSGDCAAAPLADPIVVPETASIGAHERSVRDAGDGGFLAAGMPSMPINAVLLSLAVLGLMLTGRGSGRAG
ncbi:MAG: hypothetical protein AAF577_07140 [Pseudomonadota bacterium]